MMSIISIQMAHIPANIVNTGTVGVVSSAAGALVVEGHELELGCTAFSPEAGVITIK